MLTEAQRRKIIDKLDAGCRVTLKKNAKRRFGGQAVIVKREPKAFGRYGARDGFLVRREDLPGQGKLIVWVMPGEIDVGPIAPDAHVPLGPCRRAL